MKTSFVRLLPSLTTIAEIGAGGREMLSKAAVAGLGKPQLAISPLLAICPVPSS
jgi:hypothetical protein